MPNVIKREKAHFRIEIRDLKTGKTKTISLTNHEKLTVDDIKDMVIKCLDRKV